MNSADSVESFDRWCQILNWNSLYIAGIYTNCRVLLRTAVSVGSFPPRREVMNWISLYTSVIRTAEFYRTMRFPSGYSLHGVKNWTVFH